MEKVGFFPRLVAYIIDYIIVSVVSLIILSFFGLFALDPETIATGSDEWIIKYGIGVALAVLWWLVYHVFFWSSTGQTPGKMVMGIKVVAVRDGGRVGVASSIVRLFGYLINSCILGLGFLWIIWDKNKQGWHDKFARTYVVKK